MTQFLEGKTALITGSSSGIGKALAIGFAKYGADIVVTGRNQERMDETKKEIEAVGKKAITVAANIHNYDECANVVKAGIEKFGHLDILVNNAGYSRLYPITHRKLTPEIIDNILKTNVLGPYYFSHASIPYLIEAGGGTILNTGSLAVLTPMPGWVAYSMSKSSLTGFTQALAVELKSKNINVNTIMPRMVKTPMLRGMTEELIKAMNPMKPESLVDFFAFFATENGKKVTGLNVRVDLVESVLNITRDIPKDPEVTWESIKIIVEEKMKIDEFKEIKKYKKLVDFLLKNS